MFGAGGKVSAGSVERNAPPAPATAVVESDTNFSSITTSVTTTLTLSKPTGVVEGDLMVAVVASNGGAITNPAGWTLIRSELNLSNAMKSHWKIATASEPASYDWTIAAAGGDDGGGGIMRITGHHPTTPIDVLWSGQDASGDAICGAVTASTEYSLRLRFGHGLNFPAGNIWSGTLPVSAVGVGVQRDTATSSTVGTYSFGDADDWVTTTCVILPAVGS